MNIPRDEYEMEQEEIAKVLGIHRTRVQQLEKNALRKLRKLFKERGITWDDLTTETEP